MKTKSLLDVDTKTAGALYGMFAGDALAMPVHWYYDRSALLRDYGLVDEYHSPRNPHPGSILWRSNYTARNDLGEILHDQAQYWGRRGIHYHQFLEAGENTLNLQIAAMITDQIVRDGYDPDRYLDAYVEFMRTPGAHRDTYVEEYHRGFFDNYARGLNPRQCGVEEKHIGGIPLMIPVLLLTEGTDDERIERALDHLALTHRGDRMREAGRLIAEIVLAAVAGEDLRKLIEDRIRAQTSPYLGFPLIKWLDEPDEKVIGRRLSTACYVEDSVPAVIYLALKYHEHVRAGLVSNTNLGGDNCHRGAVLGAILGAANGIEAIPQSWRQNLRYQPGL